MSGTSPASQAPQRTARSLVGLLCSPTHVRAVLMGIVELEGRVIAMASCQREGGTTLVDAIEEVLRDLELESGIHLIREDRSNADLAIVITGDPIERPRVDLLTVGDSAISTAVEQLIRRLPATLVQRDVSALVEEDIELINEREPDSDPPAIGIVMGESSDPSAWIGAGTLLNNLSAAGDLSSAVVVGTPGDQSLVAQHAGETELLGIDPSEYELQQVVASIDDELRRRYRERLSRDLGSFDEVASYVPRGIGLDLVARFVGRLQERQVWNVSLPGGLACTGDAAGQAIVLDGPSEIAPGHLAGLIDRSELFDAEACRALAKQVRGDTASDGDPVPRYAKTVASTLALVDLEAQLPTSCDLFIMGKEHVSPAEMLGAIDGAGAVATSGIMQLLEDRDDLGTLLGALAEDWPAMAADSVLLDLLEPQGVVVQLTGGGEDGELAVTGSIERQDHPTTHFAIPFGSLQRFELRTWGDAKLTLQCAPGVQVGNQSASQLTLSGSELQGGAVLIDARRLPGGQRASLAQVENWLMDLR